MMHLDDFMDNISSEISERLTGRTTSKILEDWHYFCTQFTMKEARTYLIRFFREWEGRFNPRASDFGTWIRNKAIETDQEKKIQRFNFEAPLWPRATMIKVTKGGIVYFGWLERQEHGDRGYIWESRGKPEHRRWHKSCFTIKDVRKFDLDIRLVDKKVPQEWINLNSSIAPEGLEKLLMQEEGLSVW